jgi:hypothetical protein
LTRDRRVAEHRLLPIARKEATMLQMAQDMFKMLQDRFRTTLRVVADLAESVGVPPTVTSLFTGVDRADAFEIHRSADAPISRPEPVFTPAPPSAQPPVDIERAADGDDGAERKKVSGKKRGLVGSVDLSDTVRPLEVDDAIGGSTYLARIIWSLGVAELEGTGPLRPADIARMVMSRSPVSLEPPNVARYIRRSKPTCIAIAHSEGSSSFYKLNAEGHALFDSMFRLAK